MKPIPYYDVWEAGLRTTWGDVLKAIKDVFGSKRLLGGEHVPALEARLAERHRAKHAIATSSGTDAIAIALRACWVPRGGSVVTPAFGCPATVAAIRQAGCLERFIDVDEMTGLAEAAEFAAAIDPEEAVPYTLLPVCLWGRRVDVAKLRAWRDAELPAYNRRVPIIVDAAQAFGLRGLTDDADAACLSFYPTKPLGGIADGGAILTNDDRIAERARSLRDYGRVAVADGAWAIPEYGWNARLSEAAAAALRVIERKADRAWTARSIIAAEYRSLIGSTAGVLPDDGTQSTDHIFPITVPNRDTVRKRMADLGIGTGVHYRPALPDLTASRPLSEDFPNARAWAAHELSLPCYPGLRSSHLERICDALAESLGAAGCAAAGTL